MISYTAYQSNFKPVKQLERTGYQAIIKYNQVKPSKAYFQSFQLQLLSL